MAQVIKVFDQARPMLLPKKLKTMDIAAFSAFEKNQIKNMDSFCQRMFKNARMGSPQEMQLEKLPLHSSGQTALQVSCSQKNLEHGGFSNPCPLGPLDPKNIGESTEPIFENKIQFEFEL